MNYVCIACRQELTPAEAAYDCPGCHASYPVHHGVPLLVRDIRMSTVEVLDHQIAAVSRSFDLNQDTPLRKILSTRYEFPNRDHSAENNCVLPRIRAAEREIVEQPDLNLDLDAAIVLDYIPEKLAPDAVSTHNVRIQNMGRSPLSSRGDTPVHISYHWYAIDRGLIEWDGLRTRLPIDLVPGRAITVPMAIRSPSREGQYHLRIDLVCEGVDWFGLEWPKRVTVAAPLDTYAQEHAAALELLRSWLPDREDVHVLEIGGSAAPQTPAYGCRTWNVDVDVQSLQIGALQYRERMPERRCTFVCADASDLPFSPGSFDCIAMFATLHHFADPAAMLRYLADFLMPGGFIAVMCEPLGHNVIDTQYLRELASGINEQTFSVQEYEMIFGRAGLAVEILRTDGSLKARLGTGH